MKRPCLKQGRKVRTYTKMLFEFLQNTHTHTHDIGKQYKHCPCFYCSGMASIKNLMNISISYISIVKIKHRSEKKQLIEEFICAYGSRGSESRAAEQSHSNRNRKLWAHILKSKHKAGRMNWEWQVDLKPSKSIPRNISSSKPHLLSKQQLETRYSDVSL